MKNFMMTREEVCKYLGISHSRLDRLERIGKLRSVRRLVGGKKLYPSSDVYAYMQSVWTGGNR